MTELRHPTTKSKARDLRWRLPISAEEALTRLAARVHGKRPLGVIAGDLADGFQVAVHVKREREYIESFEAIAAGDLEKTA